MAHHEPSKAVLITGCSSGIGHATAARLARNGWTVYATARRRDAIADLEPAGCRLLELDVTDEASMAAAVRAVGDEAGAVGVLVNNAGYSQSGAIETVAMDDVRRQFETNVFGLARMCQLALPAMRAQGWGRIVNLSSMGGKLTFPGGGYYHATKHAVEALSDALRFEVAGFGVKVVVVEPGAIRTGFADAATTALEDATDEWRVRRVQRPGRPGHAGGLREGPDEGPGRRGRRRGQGHREGARARNPKPRYTSRRPRGCSSASARSSATACGTASWARSSRGRATSSRPSRPCARSRRRAPRRRAPPAGRPQPQARERAAASAERIAAPTSAAALALRIWPSRTASVVIPTTIGSVVAERQASARRSRPSRTPR